MKFITIGTKVAAVEGVTAYMSCDTCTANINATAIKPNESTAINSEVRFANNVG